MTERRLAMLETVIMLLYDKVNNITAKIDSFDKYLDQNECCPPNAKNFRNNEYSSVSENNSRCCSRKKESIPLGSSETNEKSTHNTIRKQKRGSESSSRESNGSKSGNLPNTNYNPLAFRESLLLNIEDEERDRFADVITRIEDEISWLYGHHLHDSDQKMEDEEMVVRKNDVRINPEDVSEIQTILNELSLNSNTNKMDDILQRIEMLEISTSCMSSDENMIEIESLNRRVNELEFSMSSIKNVCSICKMECLKDRVKELENKVITILENEYRNRTEVEMCGFRASKKNNQYATMQGETNDLTQIVENNKVIENNIIFEYTDVNKIHEQNNVNHEKGDIGDLKD